MDLAGFPIEILFFLFFAGFTAGCIDTLAGGGGLLSLPALILSGIPPLFALGTNKLQGSMGTATATYWMFKKNKVRPDEVKILMLSAFAGSLLGTIAVQFLDTKVLNFVIPLVLFLMALYFLMAPMPNKSGGIPRVSNGIYQNIIIPVIGWYDGMFGPGTGSFFALSGVSLRGHDLIQSTAIAKTLNFSTNFASLIVFFVAGKLVWVAGLVMMAGQMLGAWAGSFFLFKINPNYLRVIVVVMCLGMLGKYALSMGWFSG